jgi:hypothetical protein
MGEYFFPVTRNSQNPKLIFPQKNKNPNIQFTKSQTIRNFIKLPFPIKDLSDAHQPQVVKVLGLIR